MGMGNPVAGCGTRKPSAEGWASKVSRGLFNLTLLEARQENAAFPA